MAATASYPAPAGEFLRPAGDACGAILIVDDNLANRKLLQAILKGEGHRLVTAEEGEQALEMARAEIPDLILLDVMMPGKDGYEVCCELRTDPTTEHIPVIFLSALSAPEDKIRGLELGAVDYITKPFDRGEVLARVRNQLEVHRLSQALRRANRALEEKQSRLDEDLKAAAIIQSTLMPSTPPPLQRVRLAWRFLPCDRVGGDLIDIQSIDADTLALGVIDVSGHGVPAAMITVSLSQFLAPQAGRVCERAEDASVVATPPAEILRRLDAAYPIERFGRHFTIAYAVLDSRSGRLRYSLAGHPMPLLVRADGRVEVLAAGGTIIGLGGLVPFDEGEVQLAPGDRLLLYTDGIVELTRPDGEQFGEERLRSALVAARCRDLEGVCDSLLSAVAEFGCGCEAQDDLTLLAVEYLGDPAGPGAEHE